MNYFINTVSQSVIDSREIVYKKQTPRSFDEFYGNTAIINSFEYYLKNNNIPNLLLVGSNGIGKYVSVQILVKKYLKSDFDKACLTINGSINRGKDVVSEKVDQKKTDKNYDGSNIINFIKKKVHLDNDVLKIIVILDYDHMTKESQMALRRIIEIYSNKARFILIANDLAKIIEAIQSRTVILQFHSLSTSELLVYMDDYCEKENLTISQSIKELLIYYCNSDLRQILLYLSILKRIPDLNNKQFYNIFKLPELEKIQQIIDCCCLPNNKQQVTTALKIVNNLLQNGYQNQDIIDYLFKVVYQNLHNKLTCDQQFKFLNIIINTYYTLENINTSLQMYNMINLLLKT